VAVTEGAGNEKQIPQKKFGKRKPPKKKAKVGRETGEKAGGGKKKKKNGGGVRGETVGYPNRKGSARDRKRGKGMYQGEQRTASS